ncbi:hypothetical protein DFP72DRAFT_504588 [Ephemerocybe angulata]|uniref:AIG1-type G domain-containing protein n=1 Tax=Ephemerocybe angulata TaxID=980116 RepID=A0A8H6HPE7_9AGAR|nr:hypothetical protein DFP72DRAFT_504588 [Tulosesus angulatus]
MPNVSALVICIGKTGAGKSTFINNLLRKNVAEVQGHSGSCTRTTAQYNYCLRDGQHIGLVDTPSLDCFNPDFDMPTRDTILDDMQEVIKEARARQPDTVCYILVFQHAGDEQPMLALAGSHRRKFADLISTAKVAVVTTQWDLLTADRPNNPLSEEEAIAEEDELYTARSFLKSLRDNHKVLSYYRSGRASCREYAPVAGYMSPEDLIHQVLGISNPSPASTAEPAFATVDIINELRSRACQLERMISTLLPLMSTPSPEAVSDELADAKKECARLKEDMARLRQDKLDLTLQLADAHGKSAKKSEEVIKLTKERDVLNERVKHLESEAPTPFDLTGEKAKPQSKPDAGPGLSSKESSETLENLRKECEDLRSQTRWVSRQNSAAKEPFSVLPTLEKASLPIPGQLVYYSTKAGAGANPETSEIRNHSSLAIHASISGKLEGKDDDEKGIQRMVLQNGSHIWTHPTDRSVHVSTPGSAGGQTAYILPALCGKVLHVLSLPFESSWQGVKSIRVEDTRYAPAVLEKIRVSNNLPFHIFVTILSSEYTDSEERWQHRIAPGKWATRDVWKRKYPETVLVSVGGATGSVRAYLGRPGFTLYVDPWQWS